MPRKPNPPLALFLTSLIIIFPSALLHAALLCVFPESIEITARNEFTIQSSEWRGIEALFTLVGLASGWFGPMLAERKWEGPVTALILIASTWCLAAVGLGLVFAEWIQGPLPTGSRIMAAFSLIGAAIGLTAWYFKAV
ncbi:MAG: hypothetical protein AABZ47_16635 [Planctomycetota bacterium]